MKNAVKIFDWKTPMKVLSITIFLAMVASVVYAAEIGRAQLNGREIILNDDNTWQYADEENVPATAAAEVDCVKIDSKTLPVGICLDEEVWVLGEQGGSAEFTFSTKDNSLFLLMITEKAQVPLKAFEKAIVANAQKAAGLKPIKVEIKERIDALGIEWGRMVYEANIEGLIITYENFFTTMKDKGSVQFVFYTTSDNYAEAEAEIEKASTQISID